MLKFHFVIVLHIPTLRVFSESVSRLPTHGFFWIHLSSDLKNVRIIALVD